MYLSGILHFRFSSYIWNTLRVTFGQKWASWDMVTSYSLEMTFLILISIIYQFWFLHLTSFWHKIDVAEVSFLWFWCHLPISVDVIIMKMPSLSLSRHKKTKPQRLQLPSELRFLWIFGCNDVFAWVSTWVNILSIRENRKDIQLGRITLDFSKHWFCGDKIVINIKFKFEWSF